MSIKQYGGVFGRNPTFNKVTADSVETNLLTVDRLSSDGTLIAFEKNGSTVGQIAVANSNNLTIGGMVAGHSGMQFGTGRIIPETAGVQSNGTVDLGQNSGRFKDAYLSGNVIVASGKGIDFSATAGTGTSELLDDYEEGTFTPSYNTSNSDANVAYASQDGEYTKICNVVYVDIYLVISSVTSTGSGNIYIEDLPFVAQTGSKTKFTISPYGVNFDAVNFYSLTASAVSNSDKLSIIGIQDNAAWAGASPSNFVVSSGSRIVINGFYFV